MTPARVTAPTEDDWGVVRDVRLAALADAPDAFESSLAREQALPEADWRGLVRAGGQRLAWLGDAPVGLARGTVHGDEHHLVGMWVSPAARGYGVAAALVRSVVDWAHSVGAPRLFLWVVGDNTAAQALYRRAGFAPTGRTQPLSTRPWQTEAQYVLDLG